MPWQEAQSIIAGARRELDERQQELWQRLVQSYGMSYTQLQTDAAILLASLADEEPTEAEIRSSHDFLNLLAMWLLGVGGFVTLASWEIRSEQNLAVLQGARNGLDLIQAMLPSKVTPNDLALLGLSLNQLPEAKQRDILYRMQTKFPLEDLLRDAVGRTHAAIGDAVIDGIRSGYSRRKIREALRLASGLGLTRALRIVNTEIHRAYTAAMQAVYQEHPDLVQAMVRRSRRDARTCVACVLLDGKIYPLGAELDDHPNGRCLLVPRLVRMSELAIDARDIEGPQTTGREWFEQQDADMQRSILGNAMYDAWQAGDVNLEDIPHKVHDDVWGDSWVPRSLKDLMGS